MKVHTRETANSAQIRHFTRQDIEDCFERFWGAGFRASGGTVTLKDIALLSGITPPTWRVEYCVDHADIDFRYHDVLLLMQHSMRIEPGRQEWYVTVPNEQPLPEGCASVQEEDVRLRQQRCAGAVPDEESS